MTRNFARNFARDFVRNFICDFARNLVRDFAGNFVRRLTASLLLASLSTLCIPHAAAAARHVRRGRVVTSRAGVANGAESAAAVRAYALRPGSQFTAIDRTRAVRRGLEFIYRTARDPSNFDAYGSDYLWCFYTVGASVSDASLRRAARRMGNERARLWRRAHRALPADADAATVTDFAFGSDAADSLGLRDERLKRQIRRAAARFGASDFLLFDPLKEQPPADVPRACAFDGTHNTRGSRVCRRCGRALKMRTRQDVWYDALITTYVGDRYGVKLGASYADVLRRLPALRPYRDSRGADDEEFYDTVYALTHVVYTLNDYGLRRIPARLLPREFAFLKANLREAVAVGDADMLGEFMDSLRALGLTDRDAEIRSGMDYLLGHQNADGSWGDAGERDVYLRYHPTWNAVAALSNYAWRGDAPDARRLRLLLALADDEAARKD
jgi:hypothetical protein